MYWLKFGAAAFIVALASAPTAVSSAQLEYRFKILADNGSSGTLALDGRGDLYGTTTSGGAYGYGTVFELSPQADGEWAETTLYNFSGGPGDGFDPSGGLVVDAAGNLYGVTTWGGLYDGGTIFELTPGNNGWTETILYNFCPQPGCPEGRPLSALTLGPDGVLYGVASALGSGAAFELTPGGGGWTLTVLYTFCGLPQCADGEDPVGNLVLDADGNLYGTAADGGLGCPDGGCGAVFVLHPLPGGGWEESVLYAFTGPPDGTGPPADGGLIMRGRVLYGTTRAGGTGLGCERGCGTVFQLWAGPTVPPKETVLHSFGNPVQGDFPNGGVVFDRRGDLFGETGAGGTGCGGGCGVVYGMKPGKNGQWEYTVLYSFAPQDGVLPIYSLTVDEKGNLYGTTLGGGPNEGGVVYEISPMNASRN